MIKYRILISSGKGLARRYIKTEDDAYVLIDHPEFADSFDDELQANDTIAIIKLLMPNSKFKLCHCIENIF
jgi:lipid A disaccharide synthetase